MPEKIYVPRPPKGIDLEKWCAQFNKPLELSDYLYRLGIPYAVYKELMFICNKFRSWNITRDDLRPYESFPYKPPKEEPERKQPGKKIDPLRPSI
jgi:hypothetical protein